ncbi:MAG: DNA gyrase inhibitor YacG [Thermodesulfobacteriota bacterium]
MPQKPSGKKKQTGTRDVCCPTCRKPVSWQDNPYRPFCSRRCQVIDLADWASDKYRIPGGPHKERPEEE